MQGILISPNSICGEILKELHFQGMDITSYLDNVKHEKLKFAVMRGTDKTKWDIQQNRQKLGELNEICNA